MERSNSTGESRTDWEKLSRLPDEKIDASDIPELDEEFFREARVRLPQGKRLVSHRQRRAGLVQAPGQRLSDQDQRHSARLRQGAYALNVITKARPIYAMVIFWPGVVCFFSSAAAFLRLISNVLLEPVMRNSVSAGASS